MPSAETEGQGCNWLNKRTEVPNSPRGLTKGEECRHVTAALWAQELALTHTAV